MERKKKHDGRISASRFSLQHFLLSCTIDKVLFIFLKRTDEPKKKKLIIRVLLINARQWYFGSKH